MSLYYLVIPNLRVQNANCISGPLSYGFPAITAFVGAMHALSRKISPLYAVTLDGVAIGAHSCTPQVYRPNEYSDYCFTQSRHPLKRDGTSPSIIEEGFAHIEVTLLVEVKGDIRWNKEEREQFCADVKTLIMQQRLAGGSVLSVETRYRKIQLIHEDDRDIALKQLSPAFILMSNQSALIEHTHTLQQSDPEKTALDALIDLCAIHMQPEEASPATEAPQAENQADMEEGKKKKVKWKGSSKKEGWLVPIPVGFKGIAPEFAPHQVAAVRAPQYPTCFVEPVYSIGEWVFASKIDDLDSVFWHYHNDFEQQLFLVAQA